MNVRKLLTISILSMVFLTACGLKGSLYLPEREEPAAEMETEPEPEEEEVAEEPAPEEEPAADETPEEEVEMFACDHCDKPMRADEYTCSHCGAEYDPESGELVSVPKPKPRSRGAAKKKTATARAKESGADKIDF